MERKGELERNGGGRRDDGWTGCSLKSTKFTDRQFIKKLKSYTIPFL